jgi:hypothetical protein
VLELLAAAQRGVCKETGKRDAGRVNTVLKVRDLALLRTKELLDAV